MALVVLEPGNICIIMSKRAELAFRLYSSFVERGRDVAVFARMHPERLEKESLRRLGHDNLEALRNLGGWAGGDRLNREF